jgi:hypothetical protein
MPDFDFNGVPTSSTMVETLLTELRARLDRAVDKQQSVRVTVQAGVPLFGAPGDGFVFSIYISESITR